MTQKSPERTALFAGSFRPFTIGHLDILMRGLELFDRVVVAAGRNCNKAASDAISQDLPAIIARYPRASFIEWDGLTVDAARLTGARWLLRSARNSADFLYEQNLADINRRIAGIDTVILTARPELACISSSMVRELASFGRDISEYLP